MVQHHTVKVASWTNEPSERLQITDTKMIQCTTVGTTNDEPTIMITTVGVPDDHEVQVHNEYQQL